MPIVVSCGHAAQPGRYTPGFGIDQHGRTRCYACCAKQDRAAMVRDGRASLYYVDYKSPRGQVSNWPESLVFPCSNRRTSRHNFGGMRTDFWFRGPDGYVWHGIHISTTSQLCHVKRTQERWNIKHS